MAKQIGRLGAIVAILLLVSCKQTEYIHTHTTSSDTVFVGSVKIDTFRLVDSVYYHIETKGDTVYSTKTKVVYRDRYKYIHDTTYISRVDTIRVPVPVERKATLWEQTKENISNLIRLAGLIVFGGFIVWFLSLLRKQK